MSPIETLVKPADVTPPRRDRQAPRAYHRGLPAVVLVIAGSALAAVSFNTLLRSGGIVPGGVVGASLIVQRAVGLEPAFSQWAINALILIGCGHYLGRGFLARSLAGSLLLPLLVLLTRDLPHPTANPLLAAICGGAGFGAGIGLVFRAGASVGGFTAVAVAANRRIGLAIDQVLWALDATVLLASACFFSGEQVLCSAICIFALGRVARAVMTGLNSSRVATIVSGRAAEIRRAILQRIPLGVTVLHGQGGYTGESREVLMIVMTPAESVRLKALVREIDPTAFVILNNATEVLGRGFSQHS